MGSTVLSRLSTETPLKPQRKEGAYLNYAQPHKNPLLIAENMLQELAASQRQRILRDLTLDQLNELIYPKALPHNTEALLKHPQSLRHLQAMRRAVAEVADQLAPQAKPETLQHLHNLALLSSAKGTSPEAHALKLLNQEAIWTLGLIMQAQKSTQSLSSLIEVLGNPESSNHKAVLQALHINGLHKHSEVKPLIQQITETTSNEETRTYAKGLLDGSPELPGKKRNSLPEWFKQMQQSNRPKISKRTGELETAYKQSLALTIPVLGKALGLIVAVKVFSQGWIGTHLDRLSRFFKQPEVQNNLKAFWKSDVPFAKDLRTIASYYKLPLSTPHSVKTV